MQRQVLGTSDIGSMREQNEDAFGTLDLPDGCFLAVCDGMGGYAGGDVASQTAVATLLDHVQRHHDPAQVAEVLRAAVTAANEAVRAKAKADSRLGEMGTTCVAALVVGERCFIAHVGDSRAYLFREGLFRLLTEDHTVVQQMVRQGRITAFEATSHPSAGILVRCLGQMDSVDVEITGPHDLAAGDRLLLCSDGLSSMLYEDDIARVLTGPAPEVVLKDLVRFANEAGGFDNITAILLQVGDLPAGALGWRIEVDSPEAKAMAAASRPAAQPAVAAAAATAHQTLMLGAVRGDQTLPAVRREMDDPPPPPGRRWRWLFAAGLLLALAAFLAIALTR